MAPTLRNILSCWNYTLYPWKLSVGFWCWNFLKPEAKNNFQRCKPTLFYSKTDICSHGAVARPPFECRSIRPGPPYIHIWNERLGADIITLKKEMMHMKIDSYGLIASNSSRHLPHRVESSHWASDTRPRPDRLPASREQLAKGIDGGCI